MINMIQEIHSKIEQNPTTQPGTNVYGFSYFEKYTEMQNAIQDKSIGNGITREDSPTLAIVELVVHPPFPSAIGALSGHDM